MRFLALVSQKPVLRVVSQKPVLQVAWCLKCNWLTNERPGKPVWNNVRNYLFQISSLILYKTPWYWIIPGWQMIKERHQFHSFVVVEVLSPGRAGKDALHFLQAECTQIHSYPCLIQHCRTTAFQDHLRIWHQLKVLKLSFRQILQSQYLPSSI